MDLSHLASQPLIHLRKVRAYMCMLLYLYVAARLEEVQSRFDRLRAREHAFEQLPPLLSVCISPRARHTQGYLQTRPNHAQNRSSFVCTPCGIRVDSCERIEATADPGEREVGGK